MGRMRGKSRRGGGRTPEGPRPSQIGGRVTAIRPQRNNPALAWVAVDGRRAARVETAALERLGVAVGVTWTAEMEAGARASEAKAAAKAYAFKAIAHRPLSVGELAAKLAARGYDPATAAAVTEDLSRVGLLNDAEFARNYVRSQLARKPAGRALLMASLRRRRVDQATAREAVDEALGGADLSRSAADLAISRVRRMSPHLEPDVVRRRLFGLLARRGFDPETAREAVERAMKAAGRERQGGGRGGESWED